MCKCVSDPTGASQCQIMDCVIPGSVDLSKVKFDAQGEDDCKHNFSLLHEAFSKNGITKVCTLSYKDALYLFFYSSVFDACFRSLLPVDVCHNRSNPLIISEHFTNRKYGNMFACLGETDYVLVTIWKYWFDLTSWRCCWLPCNPVLMVTLQEVTARSDIVLHHIAPCKTTDNQHSVFSSQSTVGLSIFQLNVEIFI